MDEEVEKEVRETRDPHCQNYNSASLPKNQGKEGRKQNYREERMRPVIKESTRRQLRLNSRSCKHNPDEVREEYSGHERPGGRGWNAAFHGEADRKVRGIHYSTFLFARLLISAKISPGINISSNCC